jgi:hypothetical protein
VSKRLACLFLLVAGCATTPRHETLVCEYKPGEPAQTLSAPRSATYGLYHAANGVPRRVLCAQVAVHEGRPIGFALGEDGKPRAVAGGESYALVSDGTYCWEATTPELPAEPPLHERFNAWADGLQTGWSEPVRDALAGVGYVVALPFLAVYYAVMIPLWLLFVGAPIYGMAALAAG